MGGGGFWTAIATGVDKAESPAESVAKAEIVWDPFATLEVSQVITYGVEVTGLPNGRLSRRNWTERTDLSSVALADRARMPDSICPGTGLTIFTEGGAVYGGGGEATTLTVIAGAVPTLPAESVALALIWCLPAGVEPMVQLYVYGAVVMRLPNG
jgi:hypothetical protein